MLLRPTIYFSLHISPVTPSELELFCAHFASPYNKCNSKEKISMALGQG